MNSILGTPASRMILLRKMGRFGALLAAPTVPLLFFHSQAVERRTQRLEEVKTKVRVPNVQTVDDIMVERCKPGDVIIFDRRPENCAAGPVAILSCFITRSLLCDDTNESVESASRSVSMGKFDHCGIVVPGYIRNAADEFDASNLLLLEATASEGIVARPLLQRFEMSQSRSVILLPLASAGEKRTPTSSSSSENYETTKLQDNARRYLEKELIKFRDTWVEISKEKKYANAHSTLSLAGAVTYALNIHRYIPGPVSPSSYFVTLGLIQGAVATNIDEKNILSIKVEDYLRDHRFIEKNTVRLRPGWKFLKPIAIRENSLT